MLCEWKVKHNSSDNLIYLMLIPFLYPRGFQEYSSLYKNFFTLWLYTSILVIGLIFVFDIFHVHKRYKKYIWFMLLYYIVFIFITLITQGGVSEGLQKLFVAPMFCLLCAMLLKKKPEGFIRCTSNLLIINFLLNITVFNPVLWSQYFNVDRHIIFLGHVQVVAQLGIVGVFLSYILYREEEKLKSEILLILSLITMIMSETAASYITVLIIVMGYMTLKIKKNLKSTRFVPLLCIGLFILANALLVVIMKKYTFGWVNNMLVRLTSGRPFIWRAAMESLKEHWLIGYGAYGVLIHVFWSPDGMNYAHNELLQRLLDGGMILMVLFLLMLFAYIIDINRSKDFRIKYYAYVCLACIFIVMIFESVTEYYYIFMLLSLFAYLPEITKKINQEKSKNGYYIKD